MIVAIKVSPTRGNHGALDRHAVIRDLVSDTCRMNKNIEKAIIPAHVDPIWTCHSGSFFI